MNKIQWDKFIQKKGDRIRELSERFKGMSGELSLRNGDAKHRVAYFFCGNERRNISLVFLYANNEMNQ